MSSPAGDGEAAGEGRFTLTLQLFEDFCVVTQSVRDGIDVDVAVEPVEPAESAERAQPA